MRNAFLGIAAVLLTSVAAAQSPSVSFSNGVFRVEGWKAPAAAPAGGWGTVFLVYASTGAVDYGKLPSLLGSWSVETGTLTFKPRYPITAGVRYHAVFRTPSGPMIARDFDGPARDTNPVARVEQVYPTADVLPSNLLRLFIVFSAPMSQGEAAARIHVEDDMGNILPNELLPGQELWDPSFRRLTMTFDPGRIKRGLTSNRTIGPPITEGRHYRLVIDKDWLDARGVPMVQSYSRSFTGGPAQRMPPDPTQWRVTSPANGTRNPLTVDFPQPMNYALMLKAISVVRGASAIAGGVMLDRHETSWRFTPESSWRAGDYKLMIDTGIEDLAGNHIGTPFDLDIFDKVSKTIERKTVSVPFTVR